MWTVVRAGSWKISLFFKPNVDRYAHEANYNTAVPSAAGQKLALYDK